MGIGLHNYHDTFLTLPFGWSDRGAGWTHDAAALHRAKAALDTLKFAEADNWDSANTPNQIACGTFITMFRCPSMAVIPKHIDNQSIPGRVPTSYRGVASSTADSDDKAPPKSAVRSS